MQSVWVKGFTGEAKEKRKKEILSYRNAFDSLKEVLEKEFKKKDSVRDYDSPGWEHKQIAVNEYNAAIDDLVKLLEIKDG